MKANAERHAKEERDRIFRLEMEEADRTLRSARGPKADDDDKAETIHKGSAPSELSLGDWFGPRPSGSKAKGPPTGLSSLSAITSSVAPTGPKEKDGAAVERAQKAAELAELENKAKAAATKITIFEVPEDRVSAIIGPKGKHLNLLQQIVNIKPNQCKVTQLDADLKKAGKDDKDKVPYKAVTVNANDYTTRQVKVLVWMLVDEHFYKANQPAGKKYKSQQEFLEDSATVKELIAKYVNNPEELRQLVLPKMGGLGAAISNIRLPQLRTPTSPTHCSVMALARPRKAILI